MEIREDEDDKKDSILQEGREDFDGKKGGR